MDNLFLSALAVLFSLGISFLFSSFTVIYFSVPFFVFFILLHFHSLALFLQYFLVSNVNTWTVSSLKLILTICKNSILTSQKTCCIWFINNSFKVAHRIYNCSSFVFGIMRKDCVGKIQRLLVVTPCVETGNTVLKIHVRFSLSMLKFDSRIYLSKLNSEESDPIYFAPNHGH